MRPPALLCAALLAALTPWCAHASVDIVVRPEDGLNGLNQALARARAARASAGPQAVRIVLKAGTYVLPEPWTLTDADSGSADAPLIIEAEQPGSVTLTGAPALPLKGAAQGRWRFVPPQGVDGLNERMGGQLYVNGQRAVLAREPNAGNWWFVQAASPDQIAMAPSDAKRLRAIMGSADQDRAIVELMQSWTSGQHRVHAFDTGAGALDVQPRPKWPMLMFGSAQRYAIENIPGALDAPGEWIAQDGQLLYLPRPEDINAMQGGQRIEAYWPRVPTLLRVQGSDDTEHRVRYVQIKGIRLAYTGALTSIRGWVDGQAAVDIPAAMEVERAEQVSISGCEVQHTGGYGIWLKRGVSHVDISHCVLDDLGAGGIKVGMPDSSAASHVTSGNAVRGNVITHTGLVYPGAVGIWVGRSGDNTISNNVIAYTSYTGISVGWTWGYDDQQADHNLVQDNVLFNIGQGTLSDMGAIYTLGRGADTDISGNVIRQVQDYPFYGAGAWGIYSDEGSSNMRIAGNVVVGARSGSYHLHYGRDLQVSNNLFASGGLAEMRWSDPAKSGDWTAKGNAAAQGSGTSDLDLNGAPPETRKRMGWTPDHALSRVDVASGKGVADIRLTGGSPEQLRAWRTALSHARQTLSDAGTLRDARPDQWRIETVATPVRPALSWNLRFDQMPEGLPPASLRYAPTNGKTPYVQVMQDPMSEAPGHCLVLLDGDPSLKKYEPFVYIKPDLAAATTHVDFDVKLDEQSTLIHEWRDSATGSYKSLLKFTLSGQQGLMINGKSLGSLPVRKWLHAKVRIDASKQSWSVELDGPGLAHRSWNNLPLINTATQLGWVGWISDTDQVSHTCLQRIDVHGR